MLFLREHGEAALRVAQQLGETHHSAIAEMRTIGLSHSAGEKLARFLLELAADHDEGKGEVKLTLTYPALESSRHVAFLVSGADKGAALARFRRGDQELPAARLRPTGELWIFADTAAVMTHRVAGVRAVTSPFWMLAALRDRRGRFIRSYARSAVACWLRNRQVKRDGRDVARMQAALAHLLAWPRPEQH